MSTSAKASIVEAQVSRLVATWPLLRAPDRRAEFVKALEREHRLAPVDIETGVDQVISLHTDAKNPPVPGEVLGLALKAWEERTGARAQAQAAEADPRWDRRTEVKPPGWKPCSCRAYLVERLRPGVKLMGCSRGHGFWREQG